jgi:metal-responsive CopG/Arc/MetJ family transcriptional regulator
MPMKTIQMTIDEELLADVDRAVEEIGTNRSLFIRHALQNALRQHAIEKLEARHAAGYAQQPPSDDELEEWINEQVWGEA